MIIEILGLAAALEWIALGVLGFSSCADRNAGLKKR